MSLNYSLFSISVNGEPSQLSHAFLKKQYFVIQGRKSGRSTKVVKLAARAGQLVRFFVRVSHITIFQKCIKTSF